MKLDLSTLKDIAASVGVLGTALGTVLTAYYGIQKLRAKPPAPLPVISGKPRVLIIDDDPSELERMRLTLNGDFEVFLFKNAYKAVAEICFEYNHKHAFDLIILDCMMEPMTGDRIVKIIQLMEMETSLRSPIVYFTRMGRLMTKPARVLDVWRKPEDHLTLLKKVRDVIFPQEG